LIQREQRRREDFAMTLTLDLPPVQAGGSHEKRVKAAVALYDAEMISQSQAAEMAGLSLSEFLSSLGRYGVSVFQYSADDAIAEARRK